MKFSAVPLEKLEELDVPMQGFYRHTLKLVNGFPNGLLYASPDVVGLRLDCLSLKCIRDKESMLHRLSALDRTYTGGLLRRGFVYAGVVPLLNVEVTCPDVWEPERGKSCWATPLLQYYTRLGISIKLPGSEASLADTQVHHLRTKEDEPVSDEVLSWFHGRGVATRGEFLMECDDMSATSTIMEFASSFEPSPLDSICLRVGQCWLLEDRNDRVVEIVGMQAFPDAELEGDRLQLHVIYWYNERQHSVRPGLIGIRQLCDHTV